MKLVRDKLIIDGQLYTGSTRAKGERAWKRQYIERPQRRVEALPSMHCNSLIITIMIFHDVRACSYDPAYRDVSLTETNISVRSYGIFRPACRDEITL